MCPFACVDICTDGAEAVVGESAGALAQVTVPSLNCRRSRCSCHRHALPVQKGNAVSKICLCQGKTVIVFNLDLL